MGSRPSPRVASCVTLEQLLHFSGSTVKRVEEKVSGKLKCEDLLFRRWAIQAVEARCMPHREASSFSLLPGVSFPCETPALTRLEVARNTQVTGMQHFCGDLLSYDPP